MQLISHNHRNKQYNNILEKVQICTEDIVLQTSGKLIVCLIELRIMSEIKYVVNALFSSYKPSEIGIAIVYGTLNAQYIETTFSHFKNIKLIKQKIDNLNRGTYSALLKTPEFYENFTDWSHVLIYQTDALLLRKIDEIYFTYDYIGAPWISSNQWCKYNAGNGGFSLRNISSCISACEQNRCKNFITEVHRGNEDGFFCSQDNFKYPPINSELHKAFSMERVNFPNPVGCHQVYHNFSMNSDDWDKFLIYMENSLIRQIKIDVGISSLIQKSINETVPTNIIKKSHDYTNNLEKLDEILHEKINKYQFTIELTHKAKNRWLITSNNNYEILFCKNPDPTSCVKSYKVHDYIESTIHKKTSGIYKKEDNDYIYIIFYPGFPNGGEPWADITASGHYNHCRELPKDGAIILKAHKIKQQIPNNDHLLKSYNLNIQHNILVYDLFTGVGFYNQLFSLECAIYLASVTKRYLIINIQHPLVACGKPDKNYGTIFDYISRDFEKYLIGYEIREYTNLFQPYKFELDLPNKFSSIVFVDKELENHPKLSEFSNGRTIVYWKQYSRLFNINEKLIYIRKSNASRMFYNFFTSEDNYRLMSEIAFALSNLNPTILQCFSEVKYNEIFYGIHLRLGDWHKSLNNNESKTIIKNVTQWLNKYNTNKYPVFIMADKSDVIFNDLLNTSNVIYTETIITQNIKNKLNTLYKNTTVAEFIIQKLFLEQSEMFIGSQGSTVSVHCHYMHFLKNKPSNLYTHSTRAEFNNIELKYNHTLPHKNYTWTKISYMGGHPTSWSMFFPDNIILPTQTLKSSNKINIINSKIYSAYNTPYSPFISVDFWYEIADIFIEKHNDISSIMKILETIYMPIIGIKTDLLPKYYSLLSNINKKFILLSVSNDDHSPPYMHYPKQDLLSNSEYLDANKLLENKNLEVWFSKNPGMVHYKLQPLPLGPKWQWKTTRFHGEDKTPLLQIFRQHCLNPKQNFLDKDLKENLVYFNFSQTTNNPFCSKFKNLRHQIKNILIPRFKWNDSTPFKEYIETLKTYKFCIAPPGRGIDTHRCWEALSVGTIPIVQSSSINNNYLNLPVLVVTDWTEITEKFLLEEYILFHKNINAYNFEKLYSPYWYSKFIGLKT